MSWEAFRLTSKSPSELLIVMGPSGVDALVREMLMESWKSLPEESRDMPSWRRRAGEVFARNMKVWSAIKKPAPAEFFANLMPYPADGHFRQALVLCHMMMPRGKRDIAAGRKVVTSIYERNLAAWEQDFVTMTKGASARTGRAAPMAKPEKPQAARKESSTKKSGVKKSTPKKRSAAKSSPTKVARAKGKR